MEGLTNPRILVNFIAILAIAFFCIAGFQYVGEKHREFSLCDKNDSATCTLTEVGPATIGALSSLGVAITTLVGGFLGITGWQYKANRSFIKSVSQVGGGSDTTAGTFVGFTMLAVSLVFALLLLYALWVSLQIDAGYIIGVDPEQQQVRPTIPPFLSQLSNTAVGLLLGAIGVLGEAAS